ncbi:hypothetical protein ACH5RR_013041 [Cinchona calisaya]|uniref:Uncharacterized protein n=1 Tax=Cinchona calisaya TaxID=153742 RepID=A0ABD2ZYX7_9GENT
MSEIGMPIFDEGVDLDKAKKWFGMIEEIMVLLKALEPLKPQAFMKYFPPTLTVQKQKEFTMLKHKPSMSIAMQYPALGIGPSHAIVKKKGMLDYKLKNCPNSPSPPTPTGG